MAEKNNKTDYRRDEEIYQISTLVAGNFELQEVLNRLAEAAVRITNTTACSIRLLDETSGDLLMRSTYGLSEEYRNKGPVTKGDPVIKAAFGGQAVVLDDMRVDRRVRYRQETLREGLISQLTVAMMFRDQPIGVLRLYSPEPSRFDQDAVRLARLVASQCAIAITNARLYSEALQGAAMNQQMNLAAAIQRRMIPQRAPCTCGLDIAAVYQPCFQIGGDLYDFFALDDKSIVVAVADVIGKGVPAAIMMSMFRGAMRAYADGGYGRHTMQEIVEKLNVMACKECRDGEFITLFLARIDAQAGSITYCNCGHEPALLIRSGDAQNLQTGGLVLGVMEKTPYQTETVEFRIGDCLLLYTDGLIDAMNFQGQTWGKERLLDVVKDCTQCTAGQFVRSILAYRRRFVGLASQLDDTTLVTIRRVEDKPEKSSCDSRQ